MSKFIATLIIDVEERFKNRKPELRMIEKFIESKIIIGEFDEKLFRQQITMKIRGIKISVLAD